jgi:hypothetical protein
MARCIPPHHLRVRYKLELSIVLWIILDSDLMPRVIGSEEAELAHEMQTSQYEAAAFEPLALLSKSQIPKSRYF